MLYYVMLMLMLFGLLVHNNNCCCSYYQLDLHKFLEENEKNFSSHYFVAISVPISSLIILSHSIVMILLLLLDASSILFEIGGGHNI